MSNDAIASSNLRLDVTLNVNAGDQAPLIPIAGQVGEYSREQFRDLFHKFAQGALQSSITVSTSLTYASNTYTIASGNLSANDTLTIGGVVLTAVASGATGAQFNIGTSALATAQNLAALINSYTNSSSNNGTVGMITASAAAGTSSSGVVTMTAAAAGSIGNAIATSKSASNGTLLHTTLVGGTTPSAVLTNLGY